MGAAPEGPLRIVRAPEFVRLWKSGLWTKPGPGRGPVAGTTPGSRPVAAAVAEIISRVEAGGQEALQQLGLEFDRADLETTEAPRDRLEAWAGLAPAAVSDALAVARDRIAAFAFACLHALHPLVSELEGAFRAGEGAWEVWCPLRRAGIYVPGGRAPYPSTVLMSVVPARVAGVGEVVLCTPPRPDGTLDPGVAAAALMAGADRVFRLGGVQAIAAMALGAGEVPRVEKIAGPGNAFVTEAKRQLFGRVGIDGLSGPSEFVAVTRLGRSRGAAAGAGRFDCEHLAWHLLAQAEHDPEALAVAVLVGPDPGDAAVVAGHLGTALDALPAARKGAASTALSARGALVTAGSLDEAAGVVEAVCPEHLWISLPAAEQASAFALRVASKAGAVFLGPWSAVAFGDYVAGPSHVLPTGGSAVWGSPLGPADFMRRVNVVKLGPQDALRLGPAGTLLAGYEGFTAHARSISLTARGALCSGGVADDKLE